MVRSRTTLHLSSPPRPKDAHKGTFGTVIVVGGSVTMIGAPAIAATAAFRAGAGLVKIMTDPVVLAACLTIEPSATGLPVCEPESLRELFDGFAENTVLAIGPGMGTGVCEREKVAALLKLNRPAVLDADGLNNLAEMDRPPTRGSAPLVMTPHPGEFARLARAAGIDADSVDPRARPDAAAEMARRYKSVVVLKGCHTVVSDGDRGYRNVTGNPALATAGTGDVLTGMIAGLMAQGMDAFDASVFGVYLHGAAADLWAKRRGPCGLLARELTKLIPDVLQAHRLTSDARTAKSD